MPVRPLRPCKHRGCGALVAGGKTYCENHASEATNWMPDRQRGNRHQRGYGSAWDKLRARILQRDAGLCQPCLRGGRAVRGTHVDHVVAKARGGSNDDSNLQTICVECHKAKTAKEGRKGAVSGWFAEGP
jgi:5-methylcytosine-specific restriction protein A